MIGVSQRKVVNKRKKKTEGLKCISVIKTMTAVIAHSHLIERRFHNTYRLFQLNHLGKFESVYFKTDHKVRG